MPQDEGTIKNRDMLPIGTRVKPAHNKFATRVGTVVGHSESFGDPIMIVHWDDDFIPRTNIPRVAGFRKFEIKEAK